MESIQRREALKRVSAIMGGALAAPTVVGILNGCAAKPELSWIPKFFSEDQARIITTVSDIILPKTDTPSASELGVPGYVEEIVSLIMDADRQKQFMDGLSEWEKECESSMGDKFNDLSAADQSIFVNDQHDKIQGKRIAPDERPFIWKIKEIVVAGYFTTEVGMTQILQYVQTPTRYDACISVEEAGGRAWGT